MKKILHTIYIGLLALAATTLTCTSCVDDDLMGNKAEVVEGEPITISLNFAAIPSAEHHPCIGQRPVRPVRHRYMRVPWRRQVRADGDQL